MGIMEALITLGRAKFLEPGQQLQVTATDSPRVVLQLDLETWRDLVATFERAGAVVFAAYSLVKTAHKVAQEPPKKCPAVTSKPKKKATPKPKKKQTASDNSDDYPF